MEHTSLPRDRVGQLIAASLAEYPESSSVYAVKGDFLMEEDLKAAELAPGDVSIRNNLEKALRDHGDQLEVSNS